MLILVCLYRSKLRVKRAVCFLYTLVNSVARCGGFYNWEMFFGLLVKVGAGWESLYLGV